MTGENKSIPSEKVKIEVHFLKFLEEKTESLSSWNKNIFLTKMMNESTLN